MTTHSSFCKKFRTRRTLSDTGQAALVLVVSFTVMLSTFGVFMVSSIINNSPVLAQASIQRYAYRALASGLNAYETSINANPYRAACNSATNGTAQCTGLTYETWSQVPGTNTGNGIIPELYKFDNPQQVITTANGPITSLEVQIVGAAGFPGKYVYYSTVAHFAPANGFLNNVWWTNYESSDFPNANASDCSHFWPSYSTLSNTCTPVYWAASDQVFGPVYSNDSLYTQASSGIFKSTVSTADPNCLFVGDPPSKTGCTTDTPPTYGQTLEKTPVDNSELSTTALSDGCYYEGPTTIAFNSAGTMTVSSPDTPGYSTNTDTATTNTSCVTNGTGPFPANGVIYVDSVSSGPIANNPFYSTTNGLSQLTSCSAGGFGASSICYYGQSGSPGNEGDAFVSDATSGGGFSGQLTVGANNDVIIDGPIIYQDCTWATPTAPSESYCLYNDSTGSTPNDVLGLIANNFVEVNRPIYNSQYSNQSSRLTPLPDCGSGQPAPPLCDPSTSAGDPTKSKQGLTVDATILGLNQSFVVNNYGACGNEGILGIYGSIQQDARGPVATSGGGCTPTGYTKNYQWDPRLALYSPPSYLTPGTASWQLSSSAESYTGQCPSMPPAQKTPTLVAVGSDLTFPIASSTACVAPT